MLDVDTWKTYRGFIELRILSALDARKVEYWADITELITVAICDLGRHLGYGVEVEKRYHPGNAEGRSQRSDVHWHGPVEHIWEIDRTLKQESARKLMAATEPEKLWVLWAKDMDMLRLRLWDLSGINVLILSHDVRKLVWDRLLSEKYHRMELQKITLQADRFATARELDRNILSE